MQRLKLVQIFDAMQPTFIVDRQVIILEKNTPTEHKLKKFMLLPPNQLKLKQLHIFSIFENEPETLHS